MPCVQYIHCSTNGNPGLPKAEYAIGYFTETGVGCRRDPLEANVWYVRAADHGEEHAKQRLAIIRASETGDTQQPVPNKPTAKILKKRRVEGGTDVPKVDKECVVM